MIPIVGIFSLFAVLIRAAAFLLLFGRSSFGFVVFVIVAEIRAGTLLGFLASFLLLRAFLVLVVIGVVILVVIFI